MISWRGGGSKNNTGLKNKDYLQSWRQHFITFLILNVSGFCKGSYSPFLFQGTQKHPTWKTGSFPHDFPPMILLYPYILHSSE